MAAPILPRIYTPPSTAVADLVAILAADAPIPDDVTEADLAITIPGAGTYFITLDFAYTSPTADDAAISMGGPGGAGLLTSFYPSLSLAMTTTQDAYNGSWSITAGGNGATEVISHTEGIIHFTAGGTFTASWFKNANSAHSNSVVKAHRSVLRARQID